MRLDKLTQGSQEALQYAQEFLARQGYEPSFGARPLKRVMQRYVSQPLANEILKGKFREGDKIKVDLKGEEIIFSRIG
ncbi:MAG: hypothetical protein A2W07_08405 [candidate division Zixibacteria bacterium RBG_16_43_9]|nr:MAG: hypothetical protein A2W07_08405 [candidate division Zixibacteria bacterium RBG_16_43_9]